MTTTKTLLAAVLDRCCSRAAGRRYQRAASSASSASVPAYVTEPFTHEQQLIEQGARLVVADGCSACHLTLSKPGLAPSFSSFAGHRVTLRDGRNILVDEQLPARRPARTHAATILKGYNPAPMLAALARLHLDGQPQQVAALAAFIEQIGPEPE